jgi:hypothetical protein
VEIALLALQMHRGSPTSCEGAAATVWHNEQPVVSNRTAGLSWVRQEE